MKSVGVICECNPFHEGHAYLFRCARESGADTVIAVMSGCFVQRGEAAIADPYLRAEALLLGGADAVLELPFPYASASAEFFAGAGVDILERLGVNELWFGSECGDIEILSRLSVLADSEEFSARYEKTATENRGTAQAYFEALQALCGDEIPCSPNDILGISYLRAIRTRNAKIKPVTVKREGSAYLDESLPASGFPSATALRNKWRQEGTDAILPYLPAPCAPIYARADASADLRYAERLILGHFRLTPPMELEQIAELSGGLGNRMAQAAQQAKTLDEFLSLSATKKYPLSRLRRGILFALIGVTQDGLRESPAYVRLLAANQTGCRFLSACRKSASIPVVTRRTDLSDAPSAAKQEETERRAYALYDMCFAQMGTILSPWQKRPIITDQGNTDQ